jgi:hypothetical protein
MKNSDKCCSLVPYFHIHEGKVDSFKDLSKRFLIKAKEEKDCMYYGFSFEGDNAHCREGYTNADGILAHLKNVASLMGEAFEIADLTRLEVHGPKEELQKLRKPLEALAPQYWIMDDSFRR